MDTRHNVGALRQWCHDMFSNEPLPMWFLVAIGSPQPTHVVRGTSFFKIQDPRLNNVLAHTMGRIFGTVKTVQSHVIWRWRLIYKAVNLSVDQRVCACRSHRLDHVDNAANKPTFFSPTPLWVVIARSRASRKTNMAEKVQSPWWPTLDCISNFLSKSAEIKEGSF